MIVSAFTNAGKAALAAMRFRPTDRWMIALYGTDAALDRRTAAYTPDGEITADRYRAGGIPLAGFRPGFDEERSYPDGTTLREAAWIRFDDAIWPVLTAEVSGALIYNASRENASLAVLAFDDGPWIARNGRFAIHLSDPTVAPTLRIE